MSLGTRADAAIKHCFANAAMACNVGRSFPVWTVPAIVMRGLDPRIHHLLKIDGLPGQARQ
jgi:hypothetical protein